MKLRLGLRVFSLCGQGQAQIDESLNVLGIVGDAPTKERCRFRVLSLTAVQHSHVIIGPRKARAACESGLELLFGVRLSVLRHVAQTQLVMRFREVGVELDGLFQFPLLGDEVACARER